jgi:hypothetical protein
MLDHMMGAADPISALLDAPSPPRAADDWQAFVEMICALDGTAGRLNSSAPVGGTNRISNGCMRTP